MQSCIDLQKMFGREYRIGRDPAYFAEYGPNAHKLDPWYWRILCKHGYVYPDSGTHLGASTDRRGAISNRIAAIPGVRVTQDGSDGINVVFPLELFADVAKIMQPRKRRRLTPAHREALANAGRTALTQYRNCHNDFKAISRDRLTSLNFQTAG